MDDEIVNWIIDLQGGQYDLNDCAKLFESGTEIRVEREQAVNSIPRYYLHSSEFQGLPDTQIHAVATKLIAKLNEAVKLQGGAGSLMMGIPVTIRADGSRIPMKVVTAVSSMPNESLANVVASATIPIEFTVVTFAELPEALRENKSPIFVKLPPWLPAFVFTAVLFVISRSDGSVNSYVIAALSSFWGLGFLV
jgi:hypothetical protein